MPWEWLRPLGAEVLVSPRVPPAWNSEVPWMVMVGPPWQGPIVTSVAHRPTMRLAGTGSAPVWVGLAGAAPGGPATVAAGAASRASETARMVWDSFMGVSAVAPAGLPCLRDPVSAWPESPAKSADRK